MSDHYDEYCGHCNYDGLSVWLYWACGFVGGVVVAVALGLVL